MSFRGCLSEGVDIFLKSVEHQGESGHDVRVSRLTPWMASVGGPVIMKKTYSLFVENSHPETLHRGRMFRLPWAFVDLKLPSAMSHTIHKIVSKERCQSYFISRRSPHLGISKDSELCERPSLSSLCLCAAHCSHNFLVISGPGADFPALHPVHTASPSRFRGRSLACWRRGSRSRR